MDTKNNKYEIMIVDDILENLKLLHDFLSKEGYSVRQVNSGKMALASIEAKHPDIILLDIKMPEMDGFEVCRQLKSDERTASIPIIFLSALTDTDDKVHAFDVGGADYITKPFNEAEVLSRVKTHLENSRMKNHLEEEVKERTFALNNAYVMLARKEEQYRNLIESLNEGYIFYSHDTDGVFTYVSPSVKGILGYTQTEFLTHFTQYMTDNPVNEKAKELTQNSIEHGQRHIPYEIELFHKGGTTCWLEITEYPVLDDKLNTIRVEGIARDITSRKSAEEALRVQIRDNKMILESAGEGIFGLDMEGRHTFVNPAAASMLGYTQEELLGELSHEIWHYKHQDGTDYPASECPIYATLNSGLPAYLGEDYFTRRDGTQFPVTFTSQPIIEEGNVTGAVVSFIDMSEKIELENRLQTNEDIMINQSKHASMGELIGMIAHQWRQPITAISMESNNIKADIELNMLDVSTLPKQMDHMSEMTQQLSKTIDDFRNFFKPVKQKEYTSIEHVITKTSNIIGKSLENNGIKFQVLNSSSSEFFTYPNELAHVFINIINNAKDAIVNKELENGKITITVEEEGDYIKSTVCDNAGGIPEDILAKVGTRYFTTKEDKGTGLGIYMSKLIVENKMDGELSWYNSEDGACFTIKVSK